MGSEALQKNGLFATLSLPVYSETTAQCKNAILSHLALDDATGWDRQSRSESGRPEWLLLADRRPTLGAGCPEPTGKHGGLWAARQRVAMFAAIPGRLSARARGGREGCPSGHAARRPAWSGLWASSYREMLLLEAR
jgi:hypothetical protein